MNTFISRIGTMVLTVSGCGLWCIAAVGQETGRATRDDAVLIVDGIVREVFRSQRQDRLDYLVEIDVKRTQADRVPRTPARVAMPAPGDILYVHVSQRSANGQQDRRIAGQNPPSSESRQVVPAERSQVRAYLVPGTRGGWEGAGASWFETTSNVLGDQEERAEPDLDRA
jgi:serine protease Do